MNTRQYHALYLRDTDVEEALRRLGGDEELYKACLNAFLEDPTTSQLNETITANQWDSAFTAAHALKGVAGNMGFIPLMHSVGQLIVLIRGGRLKEIGQSLTQVNSCYRDIIDAIQQYNRYSDGETKGE